MARTHVVARQYVLKHMESQKESANCSLKYCQCMTDIILSCFMG